MAYGDLTNIRYSNSSTMTFTKMGSGKFVDANGVSHNIAKIYFAPTSSSSDLKLIWQKTDSKTFTYSSVQANFALYDSDSSNTTFQFISTTDITTLGSYNLRYFNSSVLWTAWKNSQYTAPSDLGSAKSSLTVTSVVVNGATAYLYSVPKITNSNVLGVGANIVGSSRWGTLATIDVFTKTQLSNVGFAVCGSANYGNESVYGGQWYNWMDFTAQTSSPIRGSDL